MPFLLGSCEHVDENSTGEPKVVYQLEDLHGQWTMIDIDTIVEKQSIEVCEKRPAVEWYRPEFEVIDGVVQCINCEDFEYLPYMPTRTIEFSNDTIYEFEFPVRMRSNDQVKMVDNVLEFVYGGKYWNGVWLESVGPISIDMSKTKDTLYISYLEETGLYLEEAYVNDQFDSTVVSLLKHYRHNLPEASGTYAIVHYHFESVDYDSPFEHYHSFPHDIPETLELSKDYLMEILKNDNHFELMTDGEMKGYDLSWGWGHDLWVKPDNWLYAPDSGWYQGPDTSMHIWYTRIEE